MPCPGSSPGRLLLVAALALAAACDSAPRRSLSGVVTGDVVEGVALTLEGPRQRSAASDAEGRYAFGELPEGDYVVTPSLAGFTFEPPQLSVRLEGADATGCDFHSSFVPHAISGTVTGAGGEPVSVTILAGPTAIVDAEGRFRFDGLPDGGYTLTPSSDAFTFAPPSRTVVLSGADAEGQDFTATPRPLSISGFIRGVVIEDVTVALTGETSRSVQSGASGAFAFTGLPEGDYVVTPSKAGFTFSPASRSVELGASANGLTFDAAYARWRASGTVAGVVGGGGTLTLGGKLAATAFADSAGRFTFSGLPEGSYTVTPSKQGYAFTPTSRAFVVSAADVTGLDFAAGPAACTSRLGCDDKNPCTLDACVEGLCVFDVRPDGIIMPGGTCIVRNGVYGTPLIICHAGVPTFRCLTIRI